MTISLSKLTALEAALEYLIKATPGESLEYLQPGQDGPPGVRIHFTPNGARGYYPSEIPDVREEEPGAQDRFSDAPDIAVDRTELEPEEEREVEVVQALEAKPESSSDVKPRKKAQLAPPIPETWTSVGHKPVQRGVRPALARIFHKGFKVSDFQDMYSTGLDDFSTIIEDIRTYDAAFTSELSDIEGAVTTKKGIRIRVDIKDDSGQLAGSMTRSFKRVNGELRVNHHSFMINRLYQGKGIAADINENVEEEYEKLGVHSISLSANAEIGGYAWARQGYDFGTRSGLIKMREHFLRMLSAVASDYSSNDIVLAADKIDKFKHAWEFAKLHIPGSKRNDGHVGKEFMLGSNWTAKKILDKKSKGYQIGKAYFAEKRKEKNTS